MLQSNNVTLPAHIQKLVDALATLNPKRVVHGQPVEHNFQGGFIQINLMSNRLLQNRLIYWRKRNRIGVREYHIHDVAGIPYGMVDILLYECQRRGIPIKGKLRPKCWWNRK